MQITKLSPRRGRLTQIYIDGEQTFLVDSETLVMHGVREGQDIDDEALHALVRASDEKRARDKALWLLSHRPQTRRELYEKLCRMSSAEAAKGAVRRMEELGYIDDAGFTRRYAEELFGKGFAARRVREALLKKGIDEDICEQTIAETQPDPRAQIQRLLEGKLRPVLLRDNGRDKAAAALFRNGFAQSDIRASLPPEGLSPLRRQNEDAGQEGSDGPDEDQEERIRYLLMTKYAHALHKDKDRRRVVGALVRRGFSPERAEAAVSAFAGEDEWESQQCQ